MVAKRELEGFSKRGLLGEEALQGAGDHLWRVKGLSDFRGWAHRRRGFWGSSERIASVVIFEGRGIYEEIILYGGGFSTITFYPKIRALVPKRAFPQKYLFSRRPPASMSSSPQRAPFLNYHYFPIIFSSNKFF